MGHDSSSGLNDRIHLGAGAYFASWVCYDSWIGRPTTSIRSYKTSKPQTEPATPSGGGGGGGSTECTVSISTSQHGSVSADKSAASANQTVTLTVTPDKGYKLESLSVQSADGKDVKCREQGEGKYSFTMPKTDVTVSAVFTKDETEKTVVQNPFTDVSEGEYYYDAVLWALENDITTGIDRTHFGPNEPTTRAQVVTFLYRWMAK